MSDLHTITGLMDRVIMPYFKYRVPRIGKVSSVTDPDDLGRVLALIPSLGWDTDDKGAWCFPSEIKALKVPEIGTWVIVEWIDGNPDLPIYRGVPTYIKDQLPVTYDKNPDKKILFEQDSKNVINFLKGVLSIIVEDTLNLGGEDGKEVARKGDETLSDSSVDSSYWSALAAHTHNVLSVGNPTGPAIGAPTSLTGKINEGSAKVKAVD